MIADLNCGGKVGCHNGVVEMKSKAPSKLRVQSHDILYKTSRDILYTPAGA